jgi:hypothetical protein
MDAAAHKMQPRLQNAGPISEEATMTGAVFQPELIELMRSVLEEATAMLPKAKRTSTVQADIACAILACAAKGERDPTALKTAGLSAVVECTRYSHYISEDRRVV